MPVLEFARWVSDTTGFSVVVSSKLDAKTVSVEAHDVPLPDLMGVVARRLGVQVARTGKLYYLGDLRREDVGVLVRKVGRLNADELKAAIGVMLSEHGQATTQEDGLVVVGDRVEVLSRVNELLDQIDAAPTDAWLVQLHIISIEHNQNEAFGMDAVPALDLAATFATGGANNSFDLNIAFQSILRAEAGSDAIQVIDEPLFVMIDGSSSTISDAQEVPIPVETTTDSGFVETVDFEVISIGTTITASIREAAKTNAMLSIEYERSQLLGFVEEYPTKQAQRYTGQASVQSGGVYLLASLVTDRTANANEGQIGTIKTRETRSGVVQIWARVLRVGPGVPLGGGGPRLSGGEGPTTDGMSEPSQRVQRAYEIWQDEAPDDPTYMNWLLTGKRRLK